MYVYDKETENTRNAETGSSIRYLRMIGRQAETQSIYLYENPMLTFEFGVTVEHGRRQALSILPEPIYFGDLSDEEWRDLSQRRSKL